MNKIMLLAPGLVLLCVQAAFGFVFEPSSWTLDRTVVMQLSLGSPRTLSDGFPSFNASAQDALNAWNPYLAHLSLSGALASPVIPAQGDGEMSVSFARTVYGDDFGPGVLAMTLGYTFGAVTAETEVIFNSAYLWDSYRGPLNDIGPDFHRAAIHEFGHVLGLDHPDEAGQVVDAIMNSQISDIETPQPDDIAGVQALYGSGPAYQIAVDAPVLANISTRGFIGTGDNVLIGGFIVQGAGPATVVLRGIGFSLSEFGLAGAMPDPMLTVYDASGKQIASNDDWFVGPDAETIASYHLDPSNSHESALYLTLDPGAYTAVVASFSDARTPPTPGIGLVEVYDLHTTEGSAVNISTRGQVLTEANILIGGFIVGGSANKTIVARAIGPSLSGAGVPFVLSDPTLELRDSHGTLLQSNNDWQDGPDAQEIDDTGLAPTDAKESAFLATVPPGNYTALVSGPNGATGNGLVEVYDLSAAQ